LRTQRRSRIHRRFARQPAVDRPDRRLRAIADAQLAQDRLDVDLDRRVGDAQATRNHLVRLAIDQAAQDIHLARRQIGSAGAHIPAARNRAGRRTGERTGDLRRQNLLSKGGQAQGARQWIARNLLYEVSVHIPRRKSAGNVLHAEPIGHDHNARLGTAFAHIGAHAQAFIDVVDVDDDERWFVLDVQIINARYCAIDRKILVS
jgi:hypothetical protein